MPTLSPTLPDTLVAHALAYRFLGTAFYEAPTLEIINTLVQESLFNDWPLESNTSAAQQGLAALQAYTANWQDDQFNELKQDFAQLFVGPNRLPAPPWESVYRSKERLMFDKPTFQVRELYQQFGMQSPAPAMEPEDHFGIEMMFVAHLCQLGLAALENDQIDLLDATLAGLQTVFNAHINMWAADFLNDVRKSARTPYYQGLADLAAGCIETSTALWTVEPATES